MTEEQKKLVTENIPFVYFMAKKYINTGIEYEEIISIIKLALVEAALTYDINRKVKFTAYCSILIRNKILKYLRPIKKDIKTVSINMVLEKEDNPDDVLLIDNHNYYEDLENIDLLKNALTLLDKREKKVIVLYYFYDKTEQEIANIFHFSQAHINRIRNGAIKKMREYFKNSIGEN